MNNILSDTIPDLIVKICPLGCDTKCAEIWINETIGHRIICKCTCGHTKNQVALKLVEEPEAKATAEIPSFS